MTVGKKSLVLTEQKIFNLLCSVVFVFVLFFLYARAGAPAYAQAPAPAPGMVTRAYDRSVADEFEITFSSNSATLNRSYRANKRSFAVLDSLLGIHGLVFVDSVLVVSKSSPEGSYKNNVSLSEHRAQALYDYVVAKYPNLRDRVLSRPAGEAWDEFREMVAADSIINERARARALAIIDSDAAPDAKKVQLRKLPEYKHFLNDFFPAIRFSAIVVMFDRLAIGPPPVPELGPLQLAPDYPLPIQIDSIALRPDTLVVAPIRLRKPLLAVSTNLVYDLGGVFFPMAWMPNIAVEVPIGKSWSVYAEYDFPWWLARGNDKAFQVLKWDLGARWWFSRKRASDPFDVLRGHFVGVDLGGGYYDIEPQHSGYQGEFLLAAVEYGYSWRIADCWRVEVCAGFGWMGTQYRAYTGTTDDAHLIYQHDGRLNWLGPVKAEASIKYLITGRRRSKR